MAKKYLSKKYTYLHCVQIT